MSVIEKLEGGVEINASALMFYEIYHMKPYLIPKFSSAKIQRCTLNEGEWGKLGSVYHWHYSHGLFLILNSL